MTSTERAPGGDDARPDETPDALRFVDAPGSERFELWDGPELLAIAAYRRRAGLIAFVHTEVSEGHDGHGFSSELIRRALDEARREGLAVLPFCPFVNAYVERHTEYVDLVPAGHRAEFGL